MEWERIIYFCHPRVRERGDDETNLDAKAL